jgi:RNA polymerase sigma-70 factor (ECF subfamily)
MEQIYGKLTDNALVELTKKNEDAFAVLVDRYWQRLFDFTRRISYFSNEDIEDILQEVFIKVYRYLNDFNGDLKFSTWIYQITRNCTIDAIRKKQVRPQIAQMEDREFVNLFKETLSLENEFMLKDNLQQVKQIINELPLEYKEIMILRFLEEKNYEEIMDIIKKPKGTVASLISRGKKIVWERAKELKIATES